MIGRMQVLATLAVAIVSTPPVIAGAEQSGITSNVGVRRVAISLTFTGERVFLYGSPPAGTDTLLATMTGPLSGRIEVIRKEKVLMLWPGVKRYTITGVPGLYLVNMHCTACNGLGHCADEPDLDDWNSCLADESEVVGLAYIHAGAEVRSRRGAVDKDEAARTLDGFWDLQNDRGLYQIRRNAIRINNRGLFYHTFELPTEAPEGRYRIKTFFQRGGEVIGVAENEVLVRKSGIAAWLSRLAERQEVTYGVLAVIVPMFAGVLATVVFRRSQKH